MSKFRRSISALALASAVALVPSAPSTAATGSASDPTSDVPSAVDVTNVSVANSLSTVSASVTLHDPLPASNSGVWHDNGGARLLEVVIHANQTQDSVVRGFLYTGGSATVAEIDAESSLPNAVGLCAATTNVAGNVVTFSAPAACFGVPARVDAYGFYGDINGDYDMFATDDNDDNDPWVGAIAQEPGGQYLLGEDGGVFSLGDAQFYGSTGDIVLNEPVVSMAKNPTGEGYWFVASDGGVFTYGPQTNFYGSQGDKPLNEPIVGMAPTPTGKGYWLVASDGGIFTFGDAGFFGSKGGQPLNAPIIGMAAATSGDGYYLYAADGGVFTFGAGAAFYGSTGDLTLNEPITSMALTASGKGYWFVAADGGVFTFGDAPFYGAAVIENFAAQGEAATALLADPSGVGYRIVASNGQVYPFGNIYGYGDLGDQGLTSLNAPIVGGVNNFTLG